jgi:hypothetical protein
MNHHLKHAISIESRSINQNCSNAALESVKNEVTKTLVKVDFMEFWNSVFEEMDAIDSDKRYFQRPEGEMVLPTQPMNTTLIIGRHNYKFNDVNGVDCQMDCMSSMFRSKYANYSDRRSLSSVVAGLRNGSLEDAEDYFNFMKGKDYHLLGKALKWFKNECIDSQLKRYNDETQSADYREYNGEYILHNIRDLKRELNISKDHQLIIDEPIFPKLLDKIDEISKLEINAEYVESNNFESFCETLDDTVKVMLSYPDQMAPVIYRSEQPKKDKKRKNKLSI